MAALWTEHNRRATAPEMANRFAAGYFETAETVNEFDVQGKWLEHPVRFIGHFTLAGGVTRYALVCNPTGTWTVSQGD